MPLLIRIGVVVYILGLSLALVMGSWRLEGPVLLGSGLGYGVHAGDLAVLAATVVASIVVLRSH